MKHLTITINGVLRNLEQQFENVYRKSFIRNESLVGMDENFVAVEETLSDDDYEKINQKIEEQITLPIDTPDLMNHFKFNSKEDFEKFLYEEYAIEIFARSDAYQKAFNYIFKIQWFGELTKSFDLTLVSDEKKQAVSPTYHFLAKNACRAKNTKFVDDLKSVWDFSDIVITDSPEVLDAKPKGKISIKINKLYNQWNKSDYAFDDLKTLSDKDFLINLFPQEQKTLQS